MNILIFVINDLMVQIFSHDVCKILDNVYVHSFLLLFSYCHLITTSSEYITDC